MSSDNDSGFQAAAGLVRYFESEDQKLSFSKEGVLAVSTFLGVIVLILNVLI